MVGGEAIFAEIWGKFGATGSVATGAISSQHHSPFITNHQWTFVCLAWHPYKHDFMIHKLISGHNLVGGEAIFAAIDVNICSNFR